MPLTVRQQYYYFVLLNVSFHEIQSIFGFVTMITMAMQLLSGTMLAFSLIPEPMMIPVVRDEEDLEDNYTDDFFWLHERGVDMIVMYSYFHIFRKLYVHAYDYEHEATWKSGVYSWLLLQGVIFFGLVLCCTHLSEVTLTIAANILHTFFFFFGKFYWWLFTDKQLNSDTMVRLAYLHYILAFYIAYAGYIHTLDMHYDWKNEVVFDGVQTQLVWFDETLINELGLTKDLLKLWAFVIFVFYTDPEALNYEIFTWGDIGFVNDVRYYGVAPHWYFRPYMAWLISCPHHKTGIFGILYFFIIMFYQPTLHGAKEDNDYRTRSVTVGKYKLKKDGIRATEYYNVEHNVYTQETFCCFFFACLYTTSFLPYGRYYNQVGGNEASLNSFMYIFCYLTFPCLRKPYTWELIAKYWGDRVSRFKNYFDKKKKDKNGDKNQDKDNK